MTRIQRLMKLHRLMGPAGDGGSDAGGTGAGGEGQGAGAGGEGDGKGSDGDGSGSGDGSGKGGEGGEQGGAKPSDTEAKLLKEVMTKKKALETANTQLDEVKRKLAEFDGIDIAAVRQMLKDKEDAEAAQAEARGDFEKLKTKMAESHASEKKQLLDQVGTKDQENGVLKKQIAELTVGGAFAGSKFIPDLALPLSKARALYGAHFEFKDGAVVGYDKPEGAADRAPLVDAAGVPLAFDVALKAIVDADPDRDALYRSKLKSGAGSSTTKAKADKPAVELTGAARIAAALKAQKKA